MREPDRSTLAWVHETMGAFRIESHFAHSHGNAQLWRIAVASDHVWLKLHVKSHKWACEVHALQRWRSPLMPQVLAHRAGAVLLTECSGEDATTVAGSAAERMWTQAGEWLRAFHRRTNDWFGNVTVDGDRNGEVSTDPTHQLRKAFEMRIAQGRANGLFDTKTVEFVEANFNAGLPSLRGELAHSTHRDFHPRNWLAKSDGTLTAVIDFEHARWDLRVVDHSRPSDEEFLREPRLADAFAAGYGPADSSQVATLRIYSNVVSAVWAAEVRDDDYCRRNLDAIERMRIAKSTH